MHTDTRFVKCTFVGEEMDVFCLSGSCGAKSKCGRRRWVSAKWETIQARPT